MRREKRRFQLKSLLRKYNDMSASQKADFNKLLNQYATDYHSNFPWYKSGTHSIWSRNAHRQENNIRTRKIRNKFKRDTKQLISELYHEQNHKIMNQKFSIKEGGISIQREQEISELVDEIIGDNSNAEYERLNKALESAKNTKEAIIIALAFGYVSGLNAGKDLYSSTFNEPVGDLLTDLDFSKVTAERVAQLNDKGYEVMREILAETDDKTISNTYIIKKMVQSANNTEEALLIAAASGTMIMAVKQFKPNKDAV